MPDSITTIAKMESQGTSVKVLEYQELRGSNDIDTAEEIYYAMKVGMRLHQVQITLDNASVVVEPGAMQYMIGNIQMEVKSGGLAGLAQKAITSALTQETVYRPTYKGTGEVMLEPSFDHFILVRLEHEDMVANKGMLYASESKIELGVFVQKNLGTALKGGEGFFQTKISGSGWVVLASPVPEEEIRKVTLNNSKLLVDGNFALLRKGKIEYKVEKSTKSRLGKKHSGEGILQSFSGTGEVWLAPTWDTYISFEEDRLAEEEEAAETK